MSQEVATIPAKPLSVIERASLVFAGIKSVEELQALAKASASIVTITNDDGLKQCHSARMVLKNQRLEIARIGEEGREDAVKTSKAIIERQKALVGVLKPEEDRLAAIQEAWEARIKAEKEAKIAAEIARVNTIRERIEYLRGCQILTPASGSSLIADHICDLEKEAVDETFEEFRQQAEDAKGAGLARLRALHAAAVTHEAEPARIVAERAELARLRAESAERQKSIDAENARKEAEAQAERARVAAAAKAEQEAEAKKRADERAAQADEDRKRNELGQMRMQEIQAMQHQILIADTGRSPYCKGGDLHSIDWVIEGTEKWEVTEEKFGPLMDLAAKTKGNTLATLRQKRADFLVRLENEAQAKRIAEEQAKLDAQKEAAKPKPRKRGKAHPTKDAIVDVVAKGFSITEAEAVGILSLYDWRETAAA